MQKEKIAIIVLVVIIIAALSVFVVAVSTDYFNNLFTTEKTIAEGDYADVNYIGYYASNGTIFGSSYADPVNKTGSAPVHIFVTTNASAQPTDNFSAYTNLINDEYVPGFIENMIGMKQGQTRTTPVLSPEDAYGVSPGVGDIINLTVLANRDYKLKIISIQKNASMPELFIPYFGNATTNLYTVREESHYIGEPIDTYFNENFEPLWANASVVAKINETLIWIYTTPPSDELTNLTWVDSSSDSNPDTAYTIIYPANESAVSSINNSTFVVTHYVNIKDIITLYNYSYQSGLQFIVSNITDDNITGYYNTTVNNQTTKVYHAFPRQNVYMRNLTQNITQPYPTEYMEYALSILRTYDHRAIYSLGPLADKEVYFEITVIKVYNAS